MVHIKVWGGSLHFYVGRVSEMSLSVSFPGCTLHAAHGRHATTFSRSGGVQLLVEQWGSFEPERLGPDFTEP